MCEDLYLRKATKEDLLLLYRWANNPEVRKNAFCTNTITLEEHTIWFDKLLSDMTQKQYILMKNDTAIGQIRVSFTEDEESAVIDYSIDQRYRRHGYGVKILNLLKVIVKKDFPSIKRLIGNVKAGNISSEKCFLKSGFVEKFTDFEFAITE